MPRPLVDYAEPGGSKLKRSKGFLEPNFGVVPNEALTNTLTAGFYCRSNISPCTGLKLDFCYLPKLICRYLALSHATWLKSIRSRFLVSTE